MSYARIILGESEALKYLGPRPTRQVTIMHGNPRELDGFGKIESHIPDEEHAEVVQALDVVGNANVDGHVH